MASSNHLTSYAQVGGHHLARELAGRGWNVGYISDPLSPLHVFARNRQPIVERWRLHRSPARSDKGRLWSWVPFTPLSPRNFPVLSSSFVMRHWLGMCVPPVRAMLSRNSFSDVDILYIDSVNFGGLLDVVKFRKSVYRMADDIRGFTAVSPAALEAEKRILASVDLVAAASLPLMERAITLGAKRVIHLPNGVCYVHFAGEKLPPPSAYAGISGPRAVYVGAMESWFDFSLVRKSAEESPEVSFVFIGDEHLAKRHLGSLRNVHLLGPRRFGDLPAYLHHADVGIIPFDVQGSEILVRSVNPLKLLEYLAAGLPVVSTSWPGVATLGAPVRLCENEESFRSAIKESIHSPPNPEPLRSYAKMADWSERTEKLLTALSA